jgi:hypothetical protein
MTCNANFAAAVPARDLPGARKSRFLPSGRMILANHSAPDRPSRLLSTAMRPSAFIPSSQALHDLGTMETAMFHSEATGVRDILAAGRVSGIVH